MEEDCPPMDDEGDGGGELKKLSPFQRTSSQLANDKYEALTNSFRGVVQIFNNSARPSFSQPWTKSAPRSTTGSGFVLNVKQRLIVTNAHVVAFGCTILVRKDGDNDKYEALILTVSHQVDIAIVTVLDEMFWKDACTLPLGALPRFQQAVDVIGYPMGGSTISISSGVVSRIDWTNYCHSFEWNLCIQVDAAINAGNSGGPAMSNGVVVGVAFQGINQSDGIGYIIPVSILQRVLDDFSQSLLSSALANGCIFAFSSEAIGWEALQQLQASGPDSFSDSLIKLKGFARFAAHFQTAENPHFREALCLPTGSSGVIITQISEVSNLLGALKVDDVVMKIDGINIGNDGRILCNGLQPIDFRQALTCKLVGESIELEVFRANESLTVTIVCENPPRRMPHVSTELSHSYVMFAGLVFTKFSSDSTTGLKSTYRNEYNLKQRADLILNSGDVKFEKMDDRLVILNTVLPHRITRGYGHGFAYQPIFKINNVVMRNLNDVAAAIAEATEKYIRFEFFHPAFKNIFLPRAEGFAATNELQQKFGLTSPISRDVKEHLDSIGKKFCN